MIARYTRPEMGRLFTDQHKYNTWLAVELAVCKVWADEKVVPQAAYNRIRKNANFKVERIEAIELEVQHDVIAFTTAVAEFIGKDSAWFHRGLTSSDVVDTAQCLVLKQAGRLLEVPVLPPDAYAGSVYLYYAMQAPRERPLGYATSAPPAAFAAARTLPEAARELGVSVVVKYREGVPRMVTKP